MNTARTATDTAGSVPAWPLPTPAASGAPPAAWIFEDEQSRALLETIRRVAPTDAGILIGGAPGSDKEAIARYIHETSRRHAGPFVAVNCGALSEQLVDSELFGFEHGAFAGAFGGQPGWLEEAHEGTLFLDEIESLPPSVQSRLVRAVLDKCVARLGGRSRRRIDVRILAAGTDELEQRVATGSFRKDLYYQVSVVRLEVLPLHRRPGDILPLARHFIATYCQRLGHARTSLTPAAQQALLDHPWPGDIRELENVIHRGLLLAQERRIDVQDLALQEPIEHQPPGAQPAAQPQGFEAALDSLCASHGVDLERHVLDRLLLAAWRHNRFNQVQTARQLGISRSVVRSRLTRLGQLGARPNHPDAPASHPPALETSRDP